MEKVGIPRSKSVKDFIASEADKLMSYTLKEFYDTIHSKFYPEIEDSFKDYFFELCEKDEGDFCVQQEKLKEYGVLTNIETSGTIKRSLGSLKLTEGVEYLLTVPSGTVKRETRGGFNGNKKTYSLTPQAFKLALIRSHNENKYAKYYLLLEKIFFSYQEYQVLYKDKLLSDKDCKINNMSNKIDQQTSTIENQTNKINVLLNKNEKQSEEIKELLKYAKDTNETVHNLNEKIDSLLTLVKEFLTSQISMLYTFSEQLKNTKILVVYVTEKDDNISLALRYAQICDISKSIKNTEEIKPTKANPNPGKRNITDFSVIGAVPENMITVQSVLKDFSGFDKKSKTLFDIKKPEIKNTILKIKKIIKDNKNKVIQMKISEDKKLNEYVDAFDEIKKNETEFDTSINTLVSRFIKEKLEGKIFKQVALCKEIESRISKFKK
jgi:hypothetical protein